MTNKITTTGIPKFRALIIDDETDICYLLSSILEQQNIQTVTVSSLQQADKLLTNSEAFSVIFLDNHLPDGLGTAYISRLKHSYPGAGIIMITAQDTNADRVYAHANGADFFLRKPFSKEMILKTVREITG